MATSEAKSMKENSELYRSNISGEFHAKQRVILVEWLNSIHPDLAISTQASDEVIRAALLDGTVLCLILKKLRPVGPNEGGHLDPSLVPQSERVKKFLKALDEMGISRFELADLEKGSMKPVIECLFSVRIKLLPNATEEERRRILSESKFERALRSPIMSEPSAASIHHVGLKFHEVFQLKQGRYADLPAAKITEMMKSNSLDNAPTQSLLSVVNGILDESVDKKNGEIPHRVACLLRKVVQEIERRISTQAEHLRTQNNLFKAREEKYQSRLKVLEALANGTCEQTEMVTNRLQQIKMEKNKVEEKRKFDETDVAKLKKEKDSSSVELMALKQEMEEMKKAHELHCLQLEAEAKGAKVALEERIRELERSTDSSSRVKAALEEKIEELEGQHQQEDSSSKVKAALEERIWELERSIDSSNKVKAALEERIEELERQQIDSSSKAKTFLEERIKELERLVDSRNKLKIGLEEKIKELERQLADSRNKVKELEALLESNKQRWIKKENKYRSCMNFQFSALQDLRFSSDSIKQEVLETRSIYTDEFTRLGVKFKALSGAAENYHAVLSENRRLFNEVQDLKGNIRVYCRIRPFLPGQAGKQTIVDYIGEDGELVVANPSKPGKEGHRMFKFNKVFGPATSQAEVYSNIQPFVRSVVDGYNVCIFAYGQTGSGKTYTMTGPNSATEATLGVNYRALSDLFQISKNRGGTITYEVTVQMMEIYNEQVRDLLSSDGSQKKLGIMSASQGNGLTVPDACIHTVKATSDVMDLMDIGFKNRAVSATALNERSSRSHSVLTIHVCGTDLKTGTTLRGSLHLVDLAGSERVDRSEVTGDRLREAQHINKSLSALGDVIFSLSLKNSHVPYRNSKLTQLLQSSLGGQAKTLMFVQLNPDVSSYSESMSTLKFAERVSGVELGAAKSSKEGRDVRELMEQVTSLRDTIAKREEEIERLQLLKDVKNSYPGVSTERRGSGSSRYASPSSPSPNKSPRAGDIIQNESLEEQDFGERTSDASDISHSVEAEIDGSADNPISPTGKEQPDNVERPRSASKVARSSLRPVRTTSGTMTPTRESPRTSPASSGIKRSSSSNGLRPPSTSRRWQ